MPSEAIVEGRGRCWRKASLTIYLKIQTGVLWAGCQRLVGCRLEGELPTSGIVFSSFGATFFLPFPTIFQRHRKEKFSIPIGKIQNPEKQVLLPLVFQRVKFYHKKWKKEEHLRTGVVVSPPPDSTRFGFMASQTKRRHESKFPRELLPPRPRLASVPSN